MGNKTSLLLLLTLISWLCVRAENGTTVSNETSPVNSDEIDLESYRQRLDNQTKMFEKGLKTFLKDTVKKILPTLMSYSSDDSPISTSCMRSMSKYIGGLTSVKVWAIRMLDATSKPPAGLFEGTLSDFGGFDECLDVVLPTRNGQVEFTGQYCAIEAKPLLPPTPRNFSLAKQRYAKPLDSIGEEVKIAGMAFYYLKFRLGVCVPSKCSLEDMQGIAKQISNRFKMDVRIPQCYVKEGVVFKPIHIAVIFFLSLLLVACIAGSVVEYKSATCSSANRKLSRVQEILLCFSFISNFRRLFQESKGSEEMKALHGLRALSILWVMLGHTYVWTNFQLLRRVSRLVDWFNSIDFGSILNGWMSVEPFFILSGILTSYAAMKILPKTKGRINVPLYILRRYLRLTPPLLLTMGLVFFLPLISSGPFWYERVDPEIASCTKYWWRSILFISNWFGMKNICVHPTWYLSSDFQLHAVTVIFLLILYRYSKVALSMIVAVILACCAMVGALTYHLDVPPIILISSGNNEKIEQTVDSVHMNTFTHAGPYYVGFIAGYLIHKYKDVKMNKRTVICGWILSALVSLTSLYGAHRWNIGDFHGPLLTVIYAGLHRTTFSIGVAWVAFACVTGYGGIVNRILSLGVLAPLSRLTFMVYLLHSLVIWTRMGSLRERTFYSHYNLLYDYVGNIVTTVLITVPFYLLLEAPVSNLERLAFSGAKKKDGGGDSSSKPANGHLQANMMVSSLGNGSKVEINDTTVPDVKLMSIKQLENGCRNLGFDDGDGADPSVTKDCLKDA